MTLNLAAVVSFAGNSATMTFDRDDLYAPSAMTLLSTAEVRSSNVTVHGAPGQRAYPIVADLTAVALEIYLDPTGALNPYRAIADLREELRTELIEPPANVRGTRTATLTQDFGAVEWTAEVKVLRFMARRALGLVLVGDLLLELVDGEFLPVAS